MEVIQELAEQLGVAVENLLNAYAPYYLGQTIGITVISFIMIVVGIIMFVPSMKKMLHNYSQTEDYDELSVWTYGTIAVVSAFITLAALFSFVIHFPNLIGAIMSPQGAAINNIIVQIGAN